MEQRSAQETRSRWIDLDGPVHYLDYGGPEDGPVVVCVHGLGGSAVNWSALAPLLTGRCRVYAVDLPGHGRTWAYGRRTGVAANRVVLHRFVREVIGRPVILMGNSMGGMIALLQADAEPADVTGLVLISPAVPLAANALPDPFVAGMFALYGTPLLGRSLLAARRRFVPPEKVVDLTFDLCAGDRSRIPAEVIQEHYALARSRARYRDANRDFLTAARSVLATVADVRRGGYRGAARRVTVPVLLLHGDRDRLVPVGLVRGVARANPRWRFVELPEAGHVPMLERAEDVAAAITDWLDTTAAGRPGRRS
jgi:pimeloyl-ACP methyl ester carboxylesterase